MSSQALKMEKYIYIFLKKVFLIFREIKLSSPKIQKFIILYSFNLKIFPWKKLFNFFQKNHSLKKSLIFREMELSSLKNLIKLLYALNKTPLGEKRCLNNLYYFVIYPFFNSTPFPNTVSQDTFGTLLLTAQCVTHVTYGTPCHANGHQVLSA